MGLSKNNIILAAEQNVGRGTELDTIAENRLDYILDQIYENYTWEYLSKQPPATITFTAGSQTWIAPSDYLKFLTLMLVRSDLNASNPLNVPLEKYSFAQFQRIPNPLQTGTPQLVAINRTFTDVGAPGVTGYVWPIPNITHTGRLAYYFKPDYSITGTVEPTYPGTGDLVNLLTNELLGMGYGNAEMRKRFDPELLEKLMRRKRLNDADNGMVPLIAQKDPRVFRSGRYGRTSRSSTWDRS
jgi:hypothetical protein